MNTIASSQKNRRERIAEAMRIEWNGYVDTYTTDLWLDLMCAIRACEQEGFYIDAPSTPKPVYFGGSKHTLTLTQLEDLCELVRRSYHAQQEAKAVR